MDLVRIKKSWEFKRVYRFGKTLVSPNVVLYYHVNRLNYNRIGFSISKKIGKSVVRNRIKRIYREAFRSMRENLKKGFDFVLVARKPVIQMNFHKAREELLFLCMKGKLLN
ncbi:MAG: ribonuclease P protein component [Firmicutes bacterium]|jgi:ribonuclease P protein component|nr:ribonuclease P protein component [Bacillota bacterium]